MPRSFVLLSLALLLPGQVRAVEVDPLGAVLAKPVLDDGVPQRQVQQFCLVRVPKLTPPDSRDAWEAEAAQLRQRVLSSVVFRGEAARWREAKGKVQWLDEIPGGPGYTIRKLRYEALPGLWVPALLYRPEKLSRPAAAVMNVNGHDRANGKAADYKQLRCINQAKRGMLALNVEWLGMGQLNSPEFGHYRMNQLDLCGTAGIAPFYLTMSRGLDVLLSLDETDPERVAVAGLSGGGWQTIFISSLDTRVKLCNPVAGYSSFATRVQYHSDLGDSEQTPCDLATVADYTHLTAMLAPRPALLTFNLKDNCCFASPHALPPLLQAARPVYALYGQPQRLAHHVNEDPGNHNFERDNREALYRMLKAHFFDGDDGFPTEEIPSNQELKSKAQLEVPLPDDNASFQSLAQQLSRSLPREAQLPATRKEAEDWQSDRRQRLRNLVRVPSYRCRAERQWEQALDGVSVTAWRLQLSEPEGDEPVWTVPAVELTPAEAKETVVLLGEAGRASLAPQVAEALESGRRVLAIDPFYYGESKIPSRDFLFGLLVSAVGERPLGIQAGQLEAIRRWTASRNDGPVSLSAHGPRAGLAALVAGALASEPFHGLQLQDSYGSLKQVIEKGLGANQAPELFCFGLLREFDILQLAALSAPRPITFAAANERVQQELAPLAAHYRLWDVDLKPFSKPSIPARRPNGSR